MLVPLIGPAPFDSCFTASSRPPKLLKVGGVSFVTNTGTSSAVIHLRRPTSSSKPSRPSISHVNGSTRTDHGGILNPPSPLSAGSGGGGSSIRSSRGGGGGALGGGEYCCSGV